MTKQEEIFKLLNEGHTHEFIVKQGFNEHTVRSYSSKWNKQQTSQETCIKEESQQNTKLVKIQETLDKQNNTLEELSGLLTKLFAEVQSLKTKAPRSSVEETTRVQEVELVLEPSQETIEDALKLHTDIKRIRKRDVSARDKRRTLVMRLGRLIEEHPGLKRYVQDDLSTI